MEHIQKIKNLIHCGDENFELGITLAKNLNLYNYLNNYYKDLVAISGIKLKNLVNLTTLSLVTTLIPQSIVEFTKLKKLYIRCFKDATLILPNNFENLTNLEYIYLQGFEVPNNCLTILQKLPNLKKLKIDEITI
jgi:hypothetical protein